MTTRASLSSPRSSLADRTGSAKVRGVVRAAVAVAMAWAVVGGVLPARAADLTLDEGVVVKFGAGAQLVVRDRLVTQSGVILTSQNDDGVLGPSFAQARTAAAGDWLGVRVEKSVVGFGGVSFSDILIKHAGERAEPALYLRANSPQLQYFQVSDSVLGLRLVDGAKPLITGSSFLRNSVGLEAEGIGGLSVTSTQFSGNTTQAIVNKTPTSLITATGNWWGHASGPKDAAGNPAGLGDGVSGGVSYGGYLSSAPLLAPSVRMAQPASYVENRTVALVLSCINATEYRIVEGTGFVGVPFQPLSNGRTAVDFTVSEGDGRKPVSVQYRNATGTVTTATLSNGVLVDTQAPTVAISNPAEGSVISAAITVEAAVNDASGISKVEFYLDDKLVATRTTAPYTYAWNTDTTTDGSHTWRVIATDIAGRTTELSRPTLVSRAPVAPDVAGPVLTEVTAGGLALANGASFGRDVALSLKATDRSGVSRVEWLLDGAVVATASGSGSYSATLALGSVPNGAHTLAVRATDSLNNTSTSSYSVTVAHVAPDAPKLNSPAAGTVTRVAEATVSGTAQPGSTVQVTINGAPVGLQATAGSDGRFSQLVTLLAGVNQLQASATDSWGTSALSAVLNVTLDQTVPTAPGALTASSQALGKVRLSWVKSSDANVTGYQLYRAAQPFSAITEAVRVHTGNLSAATLAFDDLPAQQGTWYYRVVSVNAAGATSDPSSQVQALSDANAPRATAIAYTPLGKVDAATGRIGQGRVNVVVTVNEVLQSSPYLSIVPQGGTPLPVDLVKTGDFTYAGSFLVDSGTASGVANALFSARDVVGNRGTEIDAGATLKIDTEGPAVTAIVLSPTAPIKNDSAQTLQATFSFSKALRAGAQPTLSYLLSGPVRASVAITSLTQLDATTWRASFTLPSDAGLGGSENLSFASQAVDDLDNISTKVTALNRFQVYQGSLPPLNVPLGFKAVAQPGGKVALSWQAVAEASAYQVYRQGPDDTELRALVRT
ncbi:Ig-like domain-containing protein, partial [Aquabacterium sp.]|uniref:Ig-like domain-containing protein n=1 Tax=Aquabacterium sp. TaxID=1872578 RepID=UPI002486D6A3